MLIAAFAILPLINLPFDFLSLGLTRALLRRGCEPGAPHPFWLGLLDLVLALLLLLGLAAALVVAVQAADGIAWRLSGQTFLDLSFILELIAEEPGDARNGWVYFMLFSTLIPSVGNACIGTLSLVTLSLPALRHWMLTTLQKVEDRPGGWGGLGRTRLRLAAAFGLQVGIAVALTFGILWGFFALLNAALPFALPALLDALRWLAAVAAGWFGLPAFG